MRVSNLLRLLGELRQADSLSRSDLARQTGLGIPTVHRLIHELVAADLVVEIPAVQDSSLKGRPAVMYRLLERGVLVAGVDVGNETTRFAVASAAGRILASRTKPTSQLQRQLVEGIAEEIEQLLVEVGANRANLAGIGIGVAAVVDPVSGVLCNPPRYRHWQDLPLRKLIQERLGCSAIIRQDDHFSAIAEASSAGTFPGANPLVVLEIGTGIGAAMIVDGVTVMGARGRFGRIAGWPVSTPRRGRGKIHARHKPRRLRAGGGLSPPRGQGPGLRRAFALRPCRGGRPGGGCRAGLGRQGDRGTVIRLHWLCDPAGIVLGGGFARGFAIIGATFTARICRPKSS